jgi:hypothetical protein
MSLPVFHKHINRPPPKEQGMAQTPTKLPQATDRAREDALDV